MLSGGHICGCFLSSRQLTLANFPLQPASKRGKARGPYLKLTEELALCYVLLYPKAGGSAIGHFIGVSRTHGSRLIHQLQAKGLVSHGTAENSPTPSGIAAFDAIADLVGVQHFHRGGLSLWGTNGDQPDENVQ